MSRLFAHQIIAGLVVLPLQRVQSEQGIGQDIRSGCFGTERDPSTSLPFGSIRCRAHRLDQPDCLEGYPAGRFEDRAAQSRRVEVCLFDVMQVHPDHLGTPGGEILALVGRRLAGARMSAWRSPR